VSFVQFVQRLYDGHVSRPAHDRALYRFIDQGRTRRVVEIGLGSLRRTERVLRALLRQHPARELYYTGIDLFESRRAQDGPGVTLKDAYRKLRATGVPVRLMPGDAGTLSALAPVIGPTDLVLISLSQPQRGLAEAAAVLPRVLQPESRVYQEQRRWFGLSWRWQLLTSADLALLAQCETKTPRAA